MTESTLLPKNVIKMYKITTVIQITLKSGKEYEIPVEGTSRTIAGLINLSLRNETDPWMAFPPENDRLYYIRKDEVAAIVFFELHDE